MNFKTLGLATAMALATATTAFAGESWIDRWNASLNTPEAKREFYRRTCGASDPASIVNCQDMTKNGLYDHDVRIGLVAGAAIVGASVGLVAASAPVSAFGGKTLMQHWGVTHVLGAKATTAVVGLTGTAVGAAVGTVAVKATSR
jgi:hypothetical protein